MRERTRMPTHPGGILKRHYLVSLDLTVSAVARGLGVSRKTLHKILNGSGAITPDMALRLSIALGRSPESWLAMQDNYDLWHAKQQSDLRKVKRMRFTTA